MGEYKECDTHRVINGHVHQLSSHALPGLGGHFQLTARTLSLGGGPVRRQAHLLA